MLQRVRVVCWCERAGVQLWGFAVPRTEVGLLSCSVLPQELYRAAVRHERDEGGSGSNSAPV